MEKLQILIKKNFKKIIDKVEKVYDNFLLENVNDHCLRIAVMNGEYKWHYHENTDELFIVLEGELKIEFKDNDTIYLKPGDFIRIPSKIIHKTSVASRTVNLTIEKNAEDTVFID